MTIPHLIRKVKSFFQISYNFFYFIFLLCISKNCRKFERHYVVKSSKPPAKKNMWLCWPLYLFTWARDRDRSEKIRRWFQTGRHTWLPIISEQFVQLHARHFKDQLLVGTTLRGWIGPFSHRKIPDSLYFMERMDRLLFVHVINWCRRRN